MSLFVLILSICFVATSTAQLRFNTQPVQESDLRAAVIVGILRYTQWQQSSDVIEQAQSNQQQNNELTICSWGDAPSAASLADSGDQIKVRNQRLRFHRINIDDDIQSCSVLIWGDLDHEGDQSGFQYSPRAYIGPDTLIICDTCKNRQVDAVINLVRSEDRIQFDVNLNVARSAGISFSSNLLDLARKVEGI